MRRSYDVIVVGAGPAGSTCAYRLALGGASVLLLDKARFPRDKPCGGAVTARALAELPVPIDPVVERSVSQFELRLGHGKGFSRAASSPLAYLTQRRRLDAYLVEEAKRVGVDFQPGIAVRKVTPGGVDDYHATLVVGADGANGLTRRSLRSPRRIAVALEGNLTYADAPGLLDLDRLIFEFGTIRGGYGWVFPKAEHVNVGVGGWEVEGPRLRGHLERLCNAHGFAFSSLSDVRGHPLPFRRRAARLAEGGLALIGDAGGLADPLSGDGMYEAALSARLAARHALSILRGDEEDFTGYATAVMTELGSLRRRSWAAKYAFDYLPRLSFSIARTRLFWHFITTMLESKPFEPEVTPSAEWPRVRQQPIRPQEPARAVAGRRGARAR